MNLSSVNMSFSKPNYCISSRFIHPQTSNIQLQRSFIIKFPYSKSFKNATCRTKRYHCPYAFLGKWHSSSKPSEDVEDTNVDFVSRFLKENPTQVELKFRVEDNIYTLKEKEKKSDSGILEKLKSLNFKGLVKNGSEEASVMKSGDVYLNDVLKEFNGNLYVPEQIFGEKLSEEEEFRKNIEELPKMTLDDFRNYMKYDMIKLLTFEEDNGTWLRDFVVELKEMPGDKSLHRTKWEMKLNKPQARALLEEYTAHGATI